MNQKRTLGLAGLVLFSLFAGDAYANKITISGNADYRQGFGGEFNVIAADAGGGGILGNAVALGYFTSNGTAIGTADGTAMKTSGAWTGFETFCIEYNQYITIPGTYDFDISLGSKPGGVAGATNGTDLISIGTAYLYYNFATGNLTGYTYLNGSGRAGSAETLQKAIWYLEDEISLADAGGVGVGGNKFLNAVVTQYGTLTDAKSDNNVFDVAALNLGGAPTYSNQDQLILHANNFSVPDGGSTLICLGLAFGAVSLVRRKLGSAV